MSCVPRSLQELGRLIKTVEGRWRHIWRQRIQCLQNSQQGILENQLVQVSVLFPILPKYLLANRLEEVEREMFLFFLFFHRCFWALKRFPRHVTQSHGSSWDFPLPPAVCDGLFDGVLGVHDSFTPLLTGRIQPSSAASDSSLLCLQCNRFDFIFILFYYYFFRVKETGLSSHRVFVFVLFCLFCQGLGFLFISAFNFNKVTVVLSRNVGFGCGYNNWVIFVVFLFLRAELGA